MGTVKYGALQELFGRSDINGFWVADMDFECCPAIIDALKNYMNCPVLGYNHEPESFKKSIIDWQKEHHGMDVDPEWLAFVPGVVRGIAYAVNYFTKPGDKVVIQPPVYHPFRIVPEGNGRVVVNNPLIPTPGGYRMDLEGLERIFAEEKPRMMILCNPHNPGGIQWDADTLRSVASLAKKYGVIVLSDEIHGDLMFFGNSHIPFMSVSPEAAEVSITFGAPSKTFNIAGMASSWMIVPNRELREKFYHWMDVNEFSHPTFPAFVAAEAAYTKAQQWLDECMAYIEGNILAVEAWFAEHMPKIKPMRPQSSFLVWLDCRALGLTQPELVDLFVNGAKMALNDGSMFGAEGTGFMRLNVGHPRAELLEALGRLEKAANERGLK